MKLLADKGIVILGGCGSAAPAAFLPNVGIGLLGVWLLALPF